VRVCVLSSVTYVCPFADFDSVTAATPLHLVYASYGPINAEKAMWY